MTRDEAFRIIRMMTNLGYSAELMRPVASSPEYHLVANDMSQRCHVLKTLLDVIEFAGHAFNEAQQLVRNTEMLQLALQRYAKEKASVE